MESELCCPICRDLFDDDGKSPRQLGCGHSLCSSCVSRLLRKKPFCPECRRKFAVNQLNEFTINYPLLRLACYARNLEKDLISGGSNSSESNCYQKDVGECKSHGSRLFFWCTLHHAWVCRDCLVLDHQRPPLGQCEIIAAKDATDIIKRIQMEKIVAKFRDIEALKSSIEGNMKITEMRKRNWNDLRMKFDEREINVNAEVEITLSMYKKFMSNIGAHKKNLNELKFELDSELICDNIANVAKNANDMMHTLEESIDEYKEAIEHASRINAIQDVACFILEIKIEMTDEEITQNTKDNTEEALLESPFRRENTASKVINDTNVETLQSELIAAHLQIQEFKKQEMALNDLNKEISQSKELNQKKLLEIVSLKRELSERSIKQLLLENQMKNLKSEKSDLQQKIRKLNEEKVLIQCNHNKDITKMKEMEANLKDNNNNEHKKTSTEELNLHKMQNKRDSIEISALKMQLKESLKHQNSLIKRVEETEKIIKERDSKVRLSKSVTTQTVF